jgi:hypothetical protein
MSYNDFQNQDHIPDEMPPVKPGMYLATVTNVLDNNFMGVLQVKLLYAGSGNGDYSGQHLSVKYMSPFYGTTGRKHVKDINDYNNTQKSYGMWMIPPDVGTTVVVLFMQGSPRFGYWIGCVPDESMNFMIPGIAATKYAIDPSSERVPVAEYNAKINNTNNSVADASQVLKPQHPLADMLIKQGLIKDDVRGITTSSARRESPSMVFGISTPGPLDVKGPKALVGPTDDQATVLVSRLGGSTFVMDDGDDKFLREKPAGEGPPKYASVENGESSGQGDIPHNELIRLRTRTGHQILLHNSEDLIYIGNAKGTTWIELTSNGKIDIFAEDSISIHTKSDLNFNADRDINLEAGRNVNIRAAGTAPEPESAAAPASTTEKKSGRIQLESTANINLFSKADTKITSTGSSHINSTTDHIETTGGKIYMNSESKPAEIVEALKLFQLPDELGMLSIQSVMLRVPQHEPWAHHENLDPENFTAEKTDILAGQDIPVPENYNKYTATTDTFEKLKPPAATA